MKMINEKERNGLKDKKINAFTRNGGVGGRRKNAEGNSAAAEKQGHNAATWSSAVYDHAADLHYLFASSFAPTLPPFIYFSFFFLGKNIAT